MTIPAVKRDGENRVAQAYHQEFKGCKVYIGTTEAGPRFKGRPL